MYPPNPTRAYHPALDVLRGIAISFVVFYHLFDSVPFFGFGWMGVDLFFVLSGFLITQILIGSRHQQHFFLHFYLRRALRIFPIYYLLLICFFMMANVLFTQKGPNSTFDYYTSNTFWFLSYLQNWLMVTKGDSPTPYLGHLWSLAIEEQFYFFWPFMIFFVKKLSLLKKVIVALIVFCLLFRIYTWFNNPHIVEAFYCNTLTRMDSLLMGSLLAVHITEGKEIAPKWIKWAISAFLIFLLVHLVIYGNLRKDTVLFPTIGYSLTAAFFSALLYLLLHNEARLSSWIRHLGFISFLGRISYGIYIYHIPVYFIISALVTQMVSGFFDTAFETSVFIALFSIAITVAASTVSFYIIEKPILQFKKYFP